jgi:hypothetical protein
VMLVVGCAPSPPPRALPAPPSPSPSAERERRPPAPNPPPATQAPPAAPAALPQVPALAPRVTRGSAAAIAFEGVAFDSRTHRLVVADQAGGPGSRWPDAAAAARSLGGIAAVNGGFFTPEGSPLGLVVADGRPAGGWNGASSLGSGVWHEGGIARREAMGAAAARETRNLLQSGPMLVEHGRPVAGLEATRTSARTFILWDGGSRWWIGVASPCTLAELAAALADNGPAPWNVHAALNLDGGRSSELWVASGVGGGPVNRRPLWNRPVRNFLVLKQR